METKRELVEREKLRMPVPRVQMFVILILTGLVGFLSSFLFLKFGLIQMWLRYPLAILVAYAGFLVLLRLWLAVYNSRLNLEPDANVDVASVGDDTGTSDADVFGGGGAGGSWGESVSHAPDLEGGSVLEGLSLDLDELWIVIVALIGSLGGIVAVLYIVYIAPVLLAEILVDGLLVGGLYTRLARTNGDHWLQGAVRRTIVPALLCALFFGITGFAIQAIAPEAKSIGEFWKAFFFDNQ